MTFHLALYSLLLYSYLLPHLSPLSPVSFSFTMPSADARSEARVSNYTKFWQKDSAKDGNDDRANRLEQYTDVVNGYYDGATELYEYGWGESQFCAGLFC